MQNIPIKIIPPSFIGEPIAYESVSAYSDTKNWAWDFLEADGINPKTRGGNAAIFIMDTAPNFQHPDLFGDGFQQNLFYQLNKDYTSEGISEDVGVSHGTFVCSAAMSRDNGIGIIGAAPDAFGVAIKVLRSNGSGNLNNAYNAFKDLLKIGILKHPNTGEEMVKVLNLSWGAPISLNNIPLDMINVLYELEEAGWLVCAAAGNSGKTISSLANHPSVLAIGSFNKKGLRSSFSAYGAELDFMMPGEDLLLAGHVTKEDKTSNIYRKISGTSFSSPYAVGVLAVIMSELGLKTKKDLLAYIDGRTIPLSDGGWNDKTGFGYIPFTALTQKDRNPKNRFENRFDKKEPETPNEPEEPETPIRKTPLTYRIKVTGLNTSMQHEGGKFHAEDLAVIVEIKSNLYTKEVTQLVNKGLRKFLDKRTFGHSLYGDIQDLFNSIALFFNISKKEYDLSNANIIYFSATVDLVQYESSVDLPEVVKNLETQAKEILVSSHGDISYLLDFYMKENKEVA
jgi:hypothetical protein